MAKSYYNRNRINYLGKRINNLIRDFTTEDFIKSRVDRNWEKFDRLEDEEKMVWRIGELCDYLNITRDDEELY